MSLPLKTLKFAEKSYNCEVVNFPLEAEVKGLSETERQQVVLEFREKARKLARSILRKWHSRMDLQEIDSIVDLSLCEAIKRFDPTRGVGFMTFLYYHLKGNLVRAVTEAANLNMVCDFSSEDGEGDAMRPVNAIEIAAALSGNDRTLPDEKIYKQQLIDISQSACSKLDKLEQEVISRLYIHEEQLIDIAASLGYSRCHISRVKRKAIETLQNQLSEVLGEKFKQEEIK